MQQASPPCLYQPCVFTLFQIKMQRIAELVDSQLPFWTLPLNLSEVAATVPVSMSQCRYFGSKNQAIKPFICFLL